MKMILILLAVFFCTAFGSCTVYSGKIKLTSWNVQSFFDEKIDGIEYSDFIKSKAWNNDAYDERLDRLCKALKKIDSDVYVLEEIENEKVVKDIAVKLAESGNVLKYYGYACFAKEPGSAIGCAVVSRFRIDEMRVHSVSGARNSIKSPSLRPIIQVCLCTGKDRIVLFVNHWKSKSGNEDSGYWRLLQEKLLLDRIGKLGIGGKTIACGDFNQEKCEFALINDGLLKSPAIREGCLGTYFFREKWSWIDNIFYAGDIRISDYWTETKGNWCDSESQVPYGYKIWNGKGYSDHLPVSCIIECQ